MNDIQNPQSTRKRPRMITWFITATLVFLALFYIYQWRIASTPRPKLGLVDGRLQECPSSPNCVCSQSQSDSHQVEPLSFDLKSDQLIPILNDLITTQERWKLITGDDNYFHVECRTKLIGYIDDVELLIDEEQRQLHFRSASRVGYSDMGTNRYRIENFRHQIIQRMSQEADHE